MILPVENVKVVYLIGWRETMNGCSNDVDNSHTRFNVKFDQGMPAKYLMLFLVGFENTIATIT